MEETHLAAILIIDDMDVGRYATARVLRHAGFVVIEGACGADCLRLARGPQKPDLIVLDIHMPDLDGFEVCRRLKADPATAAIPVLHLTATCREDQDKIHGLNCGADAFLTQPVPSDELIATVSALLRVRQVERQAHELARGWQSAFDAISDGIGLLDAQGCLVRCNRALERIMGRDGAALAGNDVQDLLRGLFGAGAAGLLESLDGTGGPQAVERAAGAHWFRVTLDPILDEAGELSGAVLILVDVTGQRQAEQALRQNEQMLRVAMDVAELGTWTYTFCDNVVIYDERAQKMYGLSESAFLHDAPGVQNLYHPGDIPLMWQRVQAAIDPSGDGRYQVEYRVMLPGGGVRWLNAWGQVEFEGEGSERRPVRMVGASRDITERKRADAALIAQRELLEGIIDHIPVLLCIWDPALKTFRFNKHLREVLGWSEADAEGDFMAKVYPDPAYRRMVIEFMQSLEGGWRDLKSTAKDGSVIDISWANVRMTDDTSIGIGIDITERKRAEEEQKRLALQRQLALDASRLGWWHYDPLTKIARYDKRYTEILGVTGSQSPIEQILALFHPDDLPGVWAKVESALDPVDPQPYAIKCRIFHSKGSLRWIEAHGLVSFEGEGEGRRASSFVGTVQDITDRKQAEEALRQSEKLYKTMGDAIPYGVWMCNPQGGAEYASQSFLDLLEMTMEEMREFGWTRRLPPEDVEPMLKRWLHSVKTGEDWDGEHRVLGPDGQYHTILTRGKPVRDEDGNITCWAGINLDITERKNMEHQLSLQADQLRRQAEELAEADRRKDEFLAMLAHELRNPLAPVRNAVQILRVAGGRPDVLKRQQEIIDRQITHMGRLLDDLLDVSRITRGKITLQKLPLALIDVLLHVVETVSPLIRSRRHTLHFNPSTDELRVEGDLDRLAQAVGNVLINAAKYTEEGGRIWLEAGLEDGQAFIRVRDTGVGIAPEMLPHVFDLFAQADHSLERSQGGLGIGLTMVKRLVELHRGKVEAHSAGIGRGSEFIIRLPALPEDSLPTRSQPPESSDNLNANASRRVLVVDDLVDAAVSLGELLEIWGHEVRTASNGQAALDMLCDFMPEVVLMDIGMPGMNGCEVARRMRQQECGRPVRLVALTGYGQNQDREETRAAGFDAHLVKPVDLEALRTFLARSHDDWD